MTIDELVLKLRSATPDDVSTALEAAPPTNLLEFYNCMLDVMIGELDAVEAGDLTRILYSLNTRH